jgi:hypothetical protein
MSGESGGGSEYEALAPAPMSTEQLRLLGEAKGQPGLSMLASELELRGIREVGVSIAPVLEGGGKEVWAGGRATVRIHLPGRTQAELELGVNASAKVLGADPREGSAWDRLKGSASARWIVNDRLSFELAGSTEPGAWSASVTIAITF